jgi:hypothetical protein
LLASQGLGQAALHSYQQAIETLEGGRKGSLDDDSHCDLALSLLRFGKLMMTANDLERASSAIEKAQQHLSAVAQPAYRDVPALYVAAVAEAEASELATSRARQATDKAQREGFLAQARDSAQRSAEIRGQIPSPSDISPNGFLIGEPRQGALGSRSGLAR